MNRYAVFSLAVAILLLGGLKRQPQWHRDKKSSLLSQERHFLRVTHVAAPARRTGPPWMALPPRSVRQPVSHRPGRYGAVGGHHPGRGLIATWCNMVTRLHASRQGTAQAYAALRLPTTSPTPI